MSRFSINGLPAFNGSSSVYSNLVAGPGFAPGLLLAYETGVLATLPAIVWSVLQESNLVHVLFRHLL